MARAQLRRLALLAAALLAACAEAPLAPPLAPPPVLPRAEPALAPATPPASHPATPPAAPASAPAGMPREFRAAWVATVANIDWPSKPGLAAATQRAEALAILDRARAIGLNALILQVRPAGDALYPSALEPWSEVLSGEQGRAPVRAGEPAWDPLAFWVAEAHSRGLELHAWFNPFRARHSTAKSPLAAPHLAQRRPALARRYGDQLWFDPGEPAAVAHTLAVMADVLRRYEVDGVHFDDYFYPYPQAGAGGADIPFPDDESYAVYRLGGGALARDDWRRANVDGLVQAIFRTAREIRPCARVGISPFGIGRPDRRPAGISGFSQYDRLYADVERWLAQGWLDYLAPQLYWPITREGQAFPVLLDYWAAQNPARRQIWPGLFTSQIAALNATPRPWPAREIAEQIELVRSRHGEGLVGGHVHFSMTALMQDRDGIATLLRKGLYATPALPPPPPCEAKP
ncbi:GHL10 domain-containing protein [Rubrivivax sp. A210]|nr:GHL10 domain-containing protein [Rubrivivax sp. A210]